MKLPPALSWMHLFPRDASYECDASVPQWMRALCSTGFQPVPCSVDRATRHGLKTRATAMQVRIGAEATVGAGGFVGINSRASDKQFADAGFTHVRRFAVLPNLQSARWYVPLDTPAVSCAGFALYSPARFSARAKVLAAKVAAHLRLPIWYRDHIVIAQRTP